MSARTARPKQHTQRNALPPQFQDAARHEKLKTSFPAVRALLQDYLRTQQVPGLAFGLVADDALVYADALGVRHVESNAPATMDSVFRIASMSKSFVAMAILKLRDEKKLRLDDPAAKYIPELKNLAYRTRDAATITVRDLLTMSPGFPEDNPWGDRQMAISDREFTRRLRAGIPFSNAPNVTFEYSNDAYAIFGRMISRVAGMPFQKYITKHILQPLQMRATTWDKTRVPPEHFAQGYRFEDEQWKPEPVLRDGAFAAMAGLFTTIPDFARYMSFYVDAFRRATNRNATVSRATAREMQQLMRFEELALRGTDEKNQWHATIGYGYGLAIWHDERLGYGVAHGGGLPGYGSYYYLLPDCGVGFAVFSNKTYSRVGMVFTKVFQLLAETGGLQPRVILPAPILNEMREVVQRWLESGDDAEMRAHAADNFFLDQDAGHRLAEWNALRADLGALQRVGALQPHNALRGSWQIECERGTLDIFITLAPTMPPRLQMCRLIGIKPPDAR